jgi:hypothetical protein
MTEHTTQKTWCGYPVSVDATPRYLHTVTECVAVLTWLVPKPSPVTSREHLEPHFCYQTRSLILDLTLPSVQFFSRFAPSSAPASTYVSSDQTQPLSVRSLTLASIWSQAESNAASSPLTGRAGPASNPTSSQLQWAPRLHQLRHPCSNVLTTKCITLCMYVSMFSQNIFKGVSTPLESKGICNELEHLVALW